MGGAIAAAARPGELRPRHVAHRGSVVAAGLRLAAALVPEEIARRRVLDLAAEALEVFRFDDGLVVRFSRASRMDTDGAPGEPLVRHGRMLSPCPLAPDEASWLGQSIAGSTGDAVVVVAGGVAAVRLLHADRLDDLASWIDLADFAVAADLAPLGQVSEPRPSVDAASPAREDFGVGAAAPEMEAAARGLVAGRPRDERRVEGRGGGVLAELLSLFRPRLPDALARLLGRVLRRLVPGAPASARARPPLPADVGAAAPARASLAGRIRRAIVAAALRAGLARRLGRVHARYLARMIALFESNQLDDALRHAIPLGLGAGGEGEPSLRAPGPRADLAIQPRRPVGASIGLMDFLFEHLRQRYRRAFDELVRRGEIEKAAFVLAELLRASEEAVGFLERHGRLRLAAELAEGRGLAPGLIVRQWFLAGEPGRAVRIARGAGAFADAVLRLEASRPDDAAALRRLWAEDLAAAGAYPAAVDALWPVTAARDAIIGWLDRAIAVGGSTGARMLARKARLVPGAFPDVLDRTRALFAGASEEDDLAALAFTRDLVEGRTEPAIRPLARLATRRLLSSATGPADERLLRRLLDASGDPALRADVLATPSARSHAPAGLRVRAWGAARARDDEAGCEDLCVARLVAAPDPPAGAVMLDGDASGAVLLAVLDGGRGWEAEGTGDLAARLVVETVQTELRGQDAALAGDARAAGRALVGAVESAHRRLCEAAARDPLLRDLHVAGTFATLSGRTLLLAQIGNTRAFLMRGAELIEVTRPHVLLDASGASHPVILRALGLDHEFEVDLDSIEVHDGDRLMLCSEALWSALGTATVAALVRAAVEPRAAVDQILARVATIRPSDDGAIVVARFDDRAPAVRSTALLADRETPLVHRRGAADRGAIPVLDAAALPDGRLVVALGEAGALLLSRDGGVQARFAEPAEHLVLSDHGDRVLLVARRGEVIRVARLDLVARRLRAWCDARVDRFAADHDGATWFVARGDTVYAIDALADGWEYLWWVDHEAATAGSIRRDASQQLSIWFETGADEGEVWTYQGARRVLRQRRATPPGAGPMAEPAVAADGSFAAWRGAPGGAVASLLLGAAWHDLGVTAAAPGGPVEVADGWAAVPVVTAAGAIVHLVDTRDRRARARIELEGAPGPPAIRIQGERLVVADRCGRVLVLSLRNGSIVREARIS